MWPYAVALGIGVGATYVYEKFFKKNPFSPPPPGVNGYKAPPAPPNVPPSWTYQGPPQAPAVSINPKETVITIKAGNQFVTPKPGDKLTANLPTGAKWYGGNAVGIPTSIGGNTLSDATTGASAPLVLDGVNGAGTAILNWMDSSGKHQQTLLDINTTPVKA